MYPLQSVLFCNSVLPYRPSFIFELPSPTTKFDDADVLVAPHPRDVDAGDVHQTVRKFMDVLDNCGIKFLGKGYIKSLANSARRQPAQNARLQGSWDDKTIWRISSYHGDHFIPRSGW